MKLKVTHIGEVMFTSENEQKIIDQYNQGRISQPLYLEVLDDNLDIDEILEEGMYELACADVDFLNLIDTIQQRGMGMYYFPVLPFEVTPV